MDTSLSDDYKGVIVTFDAECVCTPHSIIICKKVKKLVYKKLEIFNWSRDNRRSIKVMENAGEVHNHIKI